MNARAVVLFLALGAAGFAVGFGGKRLANPAPPDWEAAAHDAAGTGSGTAPAERVRRPDVPLSAAGRKAASMAGARSSETLESILTAEGEGLYGRLALWMLDASKEEIEAYWIHYRQQPNRANEINDLIFINWTRLDPRAAISASAGTPDEHYAWWAWACHEPQAALAAVLAENPGRLNNVAWGIGEFHGEWARENFESLPESCRDNVIAGMTKWDDAADPLAVLEFLQKAGRPYDERFFKSLVRKDPWAAWDWVRGNQEGLSRYGRADSATSEVLESLAESPGALERLALETPAGALRRQIESAAFNQLLETDPEAAVQQAKAEKAPRVAAERLAAVAAHFLRTDPDKAFELAGEMFAAHPDPLNMMTMTHYPGGASGSGGTPEVIQKLALDLMAEDPGRTMDLAIDRGSSTGSGRANTFHGLAEGWAREDFERYVEWVNTKAPPDRWDEAANVVVNQLESRGQFAEAAEWALSCEQPFRMNHLFSVWSRANPEEAAGWLEAAELPDDRRQEFSRMLEEGQSATR